MKFNWTKAIDNEAGDVVVLGDYHDEGLDYHDEGLKVMGQYENIEDALKNTDTTRGCSVAIVYLPTVNLSVDDQVPVYDGD